MKMRKSFNEMTKDERDDHVFILWGQLSRKLHGAIYLMQAFNTLHRKMYLQGTSKRLAFLDIQNTKKPHWFVMMPKSKVKNCWSAISHMLLIYTALFVPFQVAFMSGEEFQTPTIDTMDQIVNILFQIDFLLNFITAIEIRGNVEF